MIVAWVWRGSWSRMRGSSLAGEVTVEDLVEVVGMREAAVGAGEHGLVLAHLQFQ
jgi:hypothetical protein